LTPHPETQHTPSPTARQRKPIELCKRPPARFNRKMEPLIRETLALSVLKADEHALQFDNIEKALQILQPLASKIVAPFFYSSERPTRRENNSDDRAEANRHIRAPKHNWRIPVLYGKLVCLLHEDKSEDAFQRIRTDLIADKTEAADGDTIPRRSKGQHTPLDPLLSRELFDDWHRRTVDRQIRQAKFRRQLLSRVRCAQNIVMRGASSNGQDTFGDGGSNPPAASQFCQHRGLPLLRRLKRRVRRAFRRRKRWLDRHLHPVSRHARRSRRPPTGPDM
jgi:hypothetical protein